MSNSLRDQLLKAGLVTEQQVREAEARPRKEERARKPDHAGRQGAPARRQGAEAKRSARVAPPPRHTPPAAPTTAPSAAARPVPRDEPRAKRALRARVRALLTAHALNDSTGEIAHNFLEGRKVKRLYVTEAQRRGLLEGSLAIAAMDGRHFLITAEIAGQAKGLDAETFIHTTSPEPSSTVDPDDPYGKYQVPDDLIW